MIQQHQTVSDIIGQIKNMLEGEFRQISLLGEVTNLSGSSSGHYYFTLSDADSSLSAALFRQDALRNPFIKTCKNGDKIFCQGQIGVYAKRGTFQLIVKNMAPAGKGDLKAQYEALKLKLAGLGLFDQEHKQKIPVLPKRIAVITAKGAAALQDFLNIYQRRSIWTDIVLVPSLVQGDQAPKFLVAALRRAIEYGLKNPDKAFDVIVLTRGGGSLEDLWAFNSEELAFEIYNSPIPIISAIGHQVDTTISDYVSDLRAETPSAAAEFLTQGQMEIRQKLDRSRRLMAGLVRQQFQLVQQKRQSHSPRSLLAMMKNRTLQARESLKNCDFLHRSLQSFSLHEKWQDIEESLDKLQTQTQKQVQLRTQKVEVLIEKLQLLDPHNVLERGYIFATDEMGKVIHSKDRFDKLKTHTPIQLIFHDGKGTVQKTQESK